MDPRMMNEWLKAQTQKQQLSTRSMEQQRQGMAITEQLNAEEEKFAKAHKHMLANMIKQYGKDKGTRVFYATVREKVKKLHENTVSVDNSPVADAIRIKLAKEQLKLPSTFKSSNYNNTFMKDTPVEQQKKLELQAKINQKLKKNEKQTDGEFGSEIQY
jgi:molybdopterin converting factor small subunit